MAEMKVEKKQNFLVRFGKRIGKFFRDGKNEIKKIVWPAPKTVFKGTGVVLLIIIIVGGFIYGLDTLLWYLLSLVMHLA